jgi:RNA polymerase sigma factor (sigma-70 family)
VARRSGNRTARPDVYLAAERKQPAVVTPFAEFYAAAWPRLLRPMVLITADRGDAEDVLQEAFAKAATNWTAVSRLDEPAAWVRRVAVNAAIDIHRRRARQRAAYRRVSVDETQLSDLSLEVADALRSLAIPERQVVVLHHLLSMTVADIAAELSRPTGTVKAQLVRGRRQLAERLRMDLEVEPS